MQLLAAKLYDPAVAVSKATSALLAMTAFDTANLRLAITVPAHGMVLFRLRAGAITGATTVPTILLGVLNGATVLGRVTPQDFPGTMNIASQSCPCQVEFIVTGLTPGAMNVDAAYAVQVLVASTNIKYGGPNTNAGANAWGAFAFEAWDPQSQTANMTIAVDANGRVDVSKVAGTAQTARDLGLQLDAAVSTRSTYAGGAVASVTADVGITQAGADKVWSTAARALTDKAGFALSAAGVQAIWDALTSALTTVGSVGKRIADNLDAAISSRSTYAGADTAGTTTLLGRLTGTRATNLDNLDAAISSRSTYAGADTAGTTTLLGRVTATRATNLDNLDAAVTTRSTYAGGAVASVTGNVGGNVVGSVASVTADVGITQTGADKVWGSAARTLTAIADSAGVTTLLARLTAIRAALLDNIDAAISSRSTYAGADTAGTTTLLARLSAIRAGLLDNLDAAISSRSTYAGADTAGTATLLGRLTAIRAGLLDYLDAAISSRGTSNYAGADTAGTTTLLGRVTAPRAALLDNIDATVSSRGAATDVTAIKAATDNLPADPADQSLVIAATDAVMARLGAPAGASLAADVAGVAAKTAALPAAPAATGDIPSAAAIATEVLTQADAAPIAADVTAINGTTITGDGSSLTPWKKV